MATGITVVFCVLILCLGVLCFFALWYYKRYFTDILTEVRECRRWGRSSMPRGDLPRR